MKTLLGLLLMLTMPLTIGCGSAAEAIHDCREHGNTSKS